MLSFIFRFWLVSGTFLWMPLFLYAQQVQKQPFTLTNKWDQKKYEGRIEVRTGMIAGKDQYSNGFWTLDFSQASTEKAGIRVTFRVKWLTEEDDFTDALYLDIKKVTPGAFLTQNTLSAQAVELTPVGDGKSMATFSLEFNASGEKYQGQIERGSKEVQYHYEIRGIDLLVVDACDDLEGSCFLDLSCLRNYLRDCPNGKHAERVKKQLVEMEAWEEATRQNRLEAFQTYIQKFPEGSFAEEAQARISGFEQEELLWNKAKTSNLLIDFEGYLSQYPQGKYANECRLAIQRLKPAPAPIPKTNKESGPPPDQQAWAALKQSFDLEQLTGFVKQFPNSDYRKYAEDRIKRITKKIAYFAEKKGPDNFFITLKNVFSPEIDSIVGQEGVQVNVTQLQNKYVFEMTYLDKEEHPVYIVDRMKNPGVASLMIPHLSELLQGKLALTEDSLFFTFKNGMPPYQLDVKLDSLHIHTFNIPADQNGLGISKAAFRKLFPGKTGMFHFEVWDNSGVNFANIKDAYFVAPNDIPWEYIIGGLALLFAVLMMRNARKKRHKQKIREQNEARKKQQQETMVILDLAEGNGENKHSKLSEENVLSGVENKSSGSRVKIKKIKKSTSEIQRKEQEAIAFKKTMQGDEFYEIDLNEIWADTAISDIYLSKHFIHDIDSFIRENNLNLKEETEGVIPEVGGFLMGHYAYGESSDQYKLVVERFVPVSPQFHNVYQLEFSTENIAVELGQVMDDFPDLVMIGWFHTHPGHGLFLSKPDLVIHDGFFKRPYQFAMEMDTETENLDTAFFTRKKNGQVNNVHDRISPAWLAWTEIEKFRRKKN